MNKWIIKEHLNHRELIEEGNKAFEEIKSILKIDNKKLKNDKKRSPKSN